MAEQTIDSLRETPFAGWEYVIEETSHGPQRKKLGVGGYGRVFEIVKEGSLDFRSAMKIISIPKDEGLIDYYYTEVDRDEQILQVLEEEKKAAEQEIIRQIEVKHNPNIVSIEDFVTQKKDHGLGWDIFIRMELLTSISEIKNGSFSQEDVRRIGIDICNALQECHKKGVLHRDIKPGNIFVDNKGHYKLGDFGISRVMDVTTGIISASKTDRYAAPEVMRLEKHRATADLYSLGLVMYELLNNGRLPFMPSAPEIIRMSDREAAVIRRVRGEQIPPIEGVSNDLNSIICKVCAFDPKDRFASAKEMKGALTRGVKEPTKTDNEPAEKIVFSVSSEPETDSKYSFPNPQWNVSDYPDRFSLKVTDPIDFNWNERPDATDDEDTEELGLTHEEARKELEEACVKVEEVVRIRELLRREEEIKRKLDERLKREQRRRKVEKRRAERRRQAKQQDEQEDFQAIRITDRTGQDVLFTKNAVKINGEEFLYTDIEEVRQSKAKCVYGFKCNSASHLIWYEEKDAKAIDQVFSEVIRLKTRKAADDFEAGDAYYYGIGREKDYEKAIVCYKEAAESQDPKAYFMLGKAYEEGNGVVKDYEEAARWYANAANAGNQYAQVRLGKMYESGKGIGQDLKEAAKWYEKAADQGNNNAKWRLQKIKAKMGE